MFQQYLRKMNFQQNPNADQNGDHLKRLLYHDSDTFVEPWNFKDAVQFQTVVLVVEIDEPTTKKIREYGTKETQLSLILGIILSCLIFPINICNFVFFMKTN